MSDAHALEHPKPNYMGVFVLLTVLTAVEVGITYMHFAQWVMVLTLVILAIVKAGMVALYFMHLKYDNKVLTVIAGVPMVLLAIAVAAIAYEFTHYTPQTLRPENSVQKK